MNEINWHKRSLTERVRLVRYVLPPLLIFIVVIYQLGIAQALEAAYGHSLHYAVEIAFYSLTGPVVTWLMLVWVERKLGQQERLEQQVQAAEHEKAAVLAEERSRIARDLHDGVAQTLYFLALKTDVLRQRLAADETAVSELRKMGQASRQIIREVRRTIFALRALDWSKTGFLPGLETFVHGFAEQTGWETAVQLDVPVPIPSLFEPVIFGLVQESLNNVAKHAEATQVEVTLFTARPTELTLIVRDNGRGFAPESISGKGLGLQQMEARVTAVHGTFHINSTTETGTAVTAVLPLTGGDHA